MMKFFFLSILVLLTSSNAFAQQDSISTDNDTTINLNEVVVKAERIVKRSDGILFLPSERQKLASQNGYSLLAKLAMPMIRIDEALHSITSVDNKIVQVRLNGVIINKVDLLSIDPKLIRSVEFINNPGLRYGDGIDYVINIKTRADKGYTIGVILTNSVSSRQGDDIIYARWNKNNSQLSLAYDFGYNDTRHIRFYEDTDYLLSDNTHYYITREDTIRREREFSNNLELKYNLADSAHYVFQTTLTGDFTHNPGGWRLQKLTEFGIKNTINTLRDNNKSFSPVLDLYFYHTIGSHQSLTSNTVATSIATSKYNSNGEGGDYSYNVDGYTWSLATEAIYENKLKPFTLSAGLHHLWKYTKNIYSGDVSSINNMHNSNLYLFSNLKGNYPEGIGGDKGSYSVGLGVSNVRYKQASSNYNYWLFRPKATLSYNISKALSITYEFEISQHNSQIAMISDTQIRTNSMEWIIGTPNIKPNRVLRNSLQIDFIKPHAYSQLYVEYRNNHNCNMACYERTNSNKFLYTQKNQPHINMFYAMVYSQIDKCHIRIFLLENEQRTSI